MKKLGEWITKVWRMIFGIILMIFGIILWLIVLFIIHKQDMLISEKIQAWAIITLVFVTLYYAWQSQGLVRYQKIFLKEEKKKRETEFWLERLKEYYLPLKMNVMKIQASLTLWPLQIDEIMKNVEIFTDLICLNEYMISEDLGQSTNNLIEIIPTLEMDFKKGEIEDKKMNDILQRVKNIIDILDSETKFIRDKLQKVYGFFTIEYKGSLRITGKKGPIEVTKE